MIEYILIFLRFGSDAVWSIWWRRVMVRKFIKFWIFGMNRFLKKIVTIAKERITNFS